VDSACSDFRATFSNTYISIDERGGGDGGNASQPAYTALFAGFAPHNAVEFAYHAPVDVAALPK
jgi:hypothetical protein